MQPILSTRQRIRRTNCARSISPLAALRELHGRLSAAPWERPALSQALKATLTATGLKMPQVAIPLRVALLGQPQSPAIDAVLEVLGREIVLKRLAAVL